MKNFGILLLLLIFIFSCKKKKLNEDLFEEASASGLAFYQNKDTVYSPASTSPHGSFKLKLNSVATAQLAPDGRLPSGTKFSSGALIVKEVYSGNTLLLYAVMKKESNSRFASRGWLWGEYNPDGKVKYSVAENGKICTSCHSEGTNRDLIRSFDLH